jgi:hypothetical protein
MPHPNEYLIHAGIETRFHAYPNSRGSRVSARRCDYRQGEKIVWINWDCDLNSQGNHVKAAQHFVKVYEVDHPIGQVAIKTQRGFVFYLNWGATLSITEKQARAANRTTARKLAKCEPGTTYRVKIDEEWRDATLWISSCGAGGTSKFWSTPDKAGYRGLFIAYWSATQSVEELG